MRGRRNLEPKPSPRLPPCKVCGQKGTGFHYGVTTCGACKGFFRRSLVRMKPYSCFGDGNCEVGPETKRRDTCPKCRYDKCLQVGMCKEGIKTGRYSYMKKSKDIEEIRMHESSGKGEKLAGKGILQTSYNSLGTNFLLSKEDLDNNKTETGTCNNETGRLDTDCRNSEKSDDNNHNVNSSHSSLYHRSSYGTPSNLSSGAAVLQPSNASRFKNIVSLLDKRSDSSTVAYSCTANNQACFADNSSQGKSTHVHHSLAHIPQHDSSRDASPFAITPEGNSPESITSSLLSDPCVGDTQRKASDSLSLQQLSLANHALHGPEDTVLQNNHSPTRGKVTCRTCHPGPYRCTGSSFAPQQTCATESQMDNALSSHLSSITDDTNDSNNRLHLSQPYASELSGSMKVEGGKKPAPNPQRTSCMNLSEDGVNEEYKRQLFVKKNRHHSENDDSTKHREVNVAYRSSQNIDIPETNEKSSNCVHQSLLHASHDERKHLYSSVPSIHTTLKRGCDVNPTDKPSGEPAEKLQKQHFPCSKDPSSFCPSGKAVDSFLEIFQQNYLGPDDSFWRDLSESETVSRTFLRQSTHNKIAPDLRDSGKTDDSEKNEARRYYSDFSDYVSKPLPWCGFTEQEMDTLAEQARHKHIQSLGEGSVPLTPQEREEIEKIFQEVYAIRDRVYNKLSATDQTNIVDILSAAVVNKDDIALWADTASYMVTGALEKYIGFMKSLPGFELLCVEDKKAICKDVFSEFYILSVFKTVSAENGVIVDAHSELAFSHSFVLTVFRGSEAYVDCVTKFAKRIKELDLCLQDVILLKAICLFSPDCPGLKEPQKIEKINWKYQSCLLLSLWRRRQDYLKVYAKIVSVMADMKVSLRAIQESIFTINPDLEVVKNHARAALYTDLIYPSRRRPGEMRNVVSTYDMMINVLRIHRKISKQRTFASPLRPSEKEKNEAETDTASVGEGENTLPNFLFSAQTSSF